MEGTLPLQYGAGRLLVRFPLGAFLLVVTLLTLLLKDVRRVGVVRVEHGALAVMLGFRVGDGVDWIGGLGGGVKRVRLNRKNSCTPRETWYFGDSVSASCLEETEG